MEKLYYRTPYVKYFDSVVVSCQQGKHDYEVILEQTGSYPEGGGQPPGTGVLGGRRVLEVHGQNGGILHCTDRSLDIGNQVTGEIDWDRRYPSIQQHTGEHLLFELMHHHYGYDNVGFHMGENEIMISFNDPLTMEQLEEVEREANRMIYENLPVNQLYPTEEELYKIDYRSRKELSSQVRIAEIPGGDICACCGTYVERTGEVGVVKVLGMISYKDSVRLTMFCRMRALEDYERKQAQVTKISDLLSTKLGAIMDAVARIKQESAGREYQINQLYQQLSRAKAEKLPAGSGLLCLYEEGLIPIQLCNYCTLLYERKKRDVVLVYSGSDGRIQYVLGSAVRDVRTLSREMNEQLHGKGGGGMLMAQGTWEATWQKVENACRERGQGGELRA